MFPDKFVQMFQNKNVSMFPDRFAKTNVSTLGGVKNVMEAILDLLELLDFLFSMPGRTMEYNLEESNNVYLAKVNFT